MFQIELVKKSQAFFGIHEKAVRMGVDGEAIAQDIKRQLEDPYNLREAKLRLQKYRREENKNVGNNKSNDNHKMTLQLPKGALPDGDETGPQYQHQVDASLTVPHSHRRSGSLRRSDGQRKPKAGTYEFSPE